MKNLMCLILLGTVLCGCNSVPVKTHSEASQADLEKIQRNGKALYESMLSNDATDAPTSREADLIDMASEKMLCEGEYKAVRVEDTESGLERIYLILQPPKSSGFQFGRHIRFDFILGTNDLDKITLSTKSCILIPPSEEKSVAAYINHILSPYPTDFHVYLNLFHNQPIYVTTELGLWEIDKGIIVKVN